MIRFLWIIIILVAGISLLIYKLRSVRNIAGGNKAIKRLQAGTLQPEKLTADHIFIAAEVALEGIQLNRMAELVQHIPVGGKMFNWEIKYLQPFGNNQVLIGVLFTHEELIVTSIASPGSSQVKTVVWMEVRPEPHRKVISVYSEMYSNNEERSYMKRCGEAILREVEKFRI